MRKVIVQEFISMDGFATDVNDALDFIPSLSGHTPINESLEQYQLEFIATVDHILLGRKTYEMFAGYWPSATKEQELVADELNRKSKIVCSETLTEAPWGNWEPVRIVQSNLSHEINILKQEEGNNIVIWGSLSLASALTMEGLVDEFILMVCPVMLGGGRAVFPLRSEAAKLQLLESRTFGNGVVMLHYQL